MGITTAKIEGDRAEVSVVYTLKRQAGKRVKIGKNRHGGIDAELAQGHLLTTPPVPSTGSH